MGKESTPVLDEGGVSSEERAQELLSRFSERRVSGESRSAMSGLPMMKAMSVRTSQQPSSFAASERPISLGVIGGIIGGGIGAALLDLSMWYAIAGAGIGALFVRWFPIPNFSSREGDGDGNSEPIIDPRFGLTEAQLVELKAEIKDYSETFGDSDPSLGL